MTKEEQKRQASALAKLGLSPEEIADVQAEDMKIDHDNKYNPFPLTEEQEKVAKKMKTPDGKPRAKAPTVYKLDNKGGRNKKSNPTKAELIAYLAKSLEDYADLENLTVTNAERQIAFAIGETKFELTLIQKRK